LLWKANNKNYIEKTYETSIITSAFCYTAGSDSLNQSVMKEVTDRLLKGR